MSTPLTAESETTRNPVAAAWGALGVIGICLFAAWRLAPYALEALRMPLTALQWVALVVNVVLMAWSEGYRGFQLKFAPRTAARVLYLYRTPMPLWKRLLAPMFCIGYFQACWRAWIVAWGGTAGIVILVLLVYRLDQPWRGIVDAGVVVGLTWGIISLIAMDLKAFRTGEYPVSPEVPDETDE